MPGVGAQTLDSVSGRIIGGLALIAIGLGVAYAYGVLKAEKKKTSLITLVNEIHKAYPDSNFSKMGVIPAANLVNSGVLSSGTAERNDNTTLNRDGMAITIRAGNGTAKNTYTLSLKSIDAQLCKKLYNLPLAGLTSVRAGDNTQKTSTDCDTINTSAPLVFNIKG